MQGLQGDLPQALLRFFETLTGSHAMQGSQGVLVVIIIVGHIVVGGLLSAETNSEWPIWVHAVLWPSLTVALTLLLLPRVKGAIVGLQWALRMHGFAAQPDGDDNPKLRPHPDQGGGI